MITHVEIAGIGPHEATTQDLDPRGASVIVGPSESGKTSLLTGIAWCLWGRGLDGRPLDAAAVREPVRVSLTAGGKTLTRESKRGKQARTIDGGAYATEEAWAEALRAVGRRSAGVPAGLLVFSPALWRELASGPGNGRALRDALVGLLPGDDCEAIEALLAEGGHAPPAPGLDLSPKTVEAMRREANRLRDEAAGRADATRRAVEGFGAPHPGDIPDATAAEAVVAARAVRVRWERAADAMEAWKRQAERHDRLGERPAPADFAALESAVTVAREALDGAQAAGSQLAERRRRADATHAAATATPEALTVARAAADAARRAARTHADTCSTCGQALPDAATHRERLDAAAGTAAAAAAKLEGEHAAAAAAAREAHAAEIAAIATEDATARDAYDAARARYAAAETALQAARASDPVARWESEKRALGPLPAKPPEPGTEPPAVSAEDCAAAEAHIRDVERVRGALDERERHLARAEQAAADAADEAVYTADRAAWAEALVDAVRRAPSHRLARAVAAMGDIGPVSVGVEGDGLRVAIDGRPWAVASSGRLVYAGAKLREGIRRLAKISAVPIGIDDAGLWSGALDIAGPTIILRTGTP